MTVNAVGWVNEGTIAISNSSEAILGGSWTNSAGASITVDSTSTLGLGSQIAIDPTSADATGYVWLNAGNIVIADGATLSLGGVFTTDAFNDLVADQAANGQSLTSDTVYLTGTIDNSPGTTPLAVVRLH